MLETQIKRKHLAKRLLEDIKEGIIDKTYYVQG